MADPITVIGAVSAFASLVELCFGICKSLNQLREDFAEAYEGFTSIKTEVEVFTSILQQITDTLKEGRERGIELQVKTGEGLHNILINCTTLLLGLRKILAKFRDFSDLVGQGRPTSILVIKMRLRWMMEERKITKIQMSLKKQKDTLNTQLLVVLVVLV